jgi:uncharacterized protein YxjI
MFLPPTPPAWTSSIGYTLPVAAAQSLEQALATAQCLILSEQVGMAQAAVQLVGFDTAKRFAIHISPTEIVGQVVEDTTGVWSFVRSLIWRANRPFRMRVLSGDRVAMTIERPFFWFLSTLHLRDGNGIILARLEQRFSLLKRVFDICDAAGNCVGHMSGSLFRPWRFEVQVGRGDQAVVMARIEKRWSGTFREFFSSSNNFALLLPGQGDLPLGQVVLAAALLVDFCYFEQAPAAGEMLNRGLNPVGDLGIPPSDAGGGVPNIPVSNDGGSSL